MKGWVVRGVGTPQDVFEWDEVPEPTHEAMRELTVDFAGLRPRREGEPPFESYVFIDVLAAALAIRSSYCALAHARKLIAREFTQAEMVAILAGRDILMAAPEDAEAKRAPGLDRPDAVRAFLLVSPAFLAACSSSSICLALTS